MNAGQNYIKNQKPRNSRDTLGFPGIPRDDPTCTATTAARKASVPSHLSRDVVPETYLHIKEATFLKKEFLQLVKIYFHGFPAAHKLYEINCRWFP